MFLIIDLDNFEGFFPYCDQLVLLNHRNLHPHETLLRNCSVHNHHQALLLLLNYPHHHHQKRHAFFCEIVRVFTTCKVKLFSPFSDCKKLPLDSIPFGRHLSPAHSSKKWK